MIFLSLVSEWVLMFLVSGCAASASRRATSAKKTSVKKMCCEIMIVMIVWCEM